MRRVALIGLLFLLASCSFSRSLPKKLTFVPADPTASFAPETVESSCGVFKKRLASQTGVDFAVDCRGDTIEVALAENADEQAIANLLIATGSVEFIDPKGEYLEEGTAVCTTTYRVLPKTPTFAGESCQTIYQTIVGDSQLRRDSLKVTTDEADNPALAFAFDEQGASAIEAFTAANIGKPMSIVVDQRVLSSPMIQGTLPGEGVITFGTGSKAEQEQQAQQLLSALESGPLPMGWELQQ